MNFLNDKRFVLTIGPPDNGEKYPLLDEIKKLYDKGEKEEYDKFYEIQEQTLSKLINAL